MATDSELDTWLDTVSKCKYLPEKEFFRLCEIVRPCPGCPRPSDPHLWSRRSRSVCWRSLMFNL